MNDILAFVNTHGLNIITLLLVLLSLFKEQLRAMIQRRIDRTAQKEDQDAGVEAQAWARVFQNGMKANGYVERLLLQQEHHLASMRERDTHIERFTTVSVEAIRDAVAVMEAMINRQEKTDGKTAEGLAELINTLTALREHTAAIGIVMGLYLHDRQGVTWDELLAIMARSDATKENPLPKAQREE